MDIVGRNIREKIKELGRLWKLSKNRLKISNNVLNSWNRLISEWAEDENIPLIIRKFNKRGEIVNHPSGREIIFSDNTFAAWVYSEALNRKTYELSKLRGKLAKKEIPMIFALNKKEKAKLESISGYTKTLGKNPLSGFKLCHIKPVGLNNDNKIEYLDINEIIKYFKRYANPINMFLLPKDIGGLGEIQEFIDEQKPLNIDKSVL